MTVFNWAAARGGTRLGLKDTRCYCYCYFLAPSVLFFSLIWLPWHLRHLRAEIGFFPPHLKQILKKSLLCCAICFFVASVIGIVWIRFDSGHYFTFLLCLFVGHDR